MPTDYGLCINALGEGRCTATVGALRIRQEPHSAGAIIGGLQPGELADVWMLAGDWCRVQTRAGVTGWAHRSYLQGVLRP